MKARILLLLIALSEVLAVSAQAQTTPTDGNLFYTRYCGAGAHVRRTTFVFDGATFTLGANVDVAFPPGADGIAFAPDHDLLVGGQGNALHKINPMTGAFQTQSSGGIIYHVMVDPAGNRVWGAGLPGQLSSFPLNPFGPGMVHGITGDDTQVVQVTWAGSTAFYTRSNPNGFGNFGTIDMTTFQTTRYLTGIAGAHGMAFDSMTGDLFLFGGSEIVQIDPTAPTVIKSSLDLSGSLTSTLDQGTVDGSGHAFVAENGGNLVFVDYSASGLIGNASNFVSVQFLDDCLDDIAPLSGPGKEPPQCFTLNFSTEDDMVTPLGNGQLIDTEFGSLVRISGSGANLGPVTFDSDVGGPNDPSINTDMLVNHGNMLLLQENAYPNQSSPGFFDTVTDDVNGGDLIFDFVLPVSPQSVLLADINPPPNLGASVTLIDGADKTRVYAIEPGWTGGYGNAGPHLLDLMTMDRQAGNGTPRFATATEDLGFQQTGVVKMIVHLTGYGAMDELTVCTSSLALASAHTRNGGGVNPVILRSMSNPVLGRLWGAELDCSAHGQGIAALILRGLPMAGAVTPLGEGLIAGSLLNKAARAYSSSASLFTWRIPSSLALCGVEVHAQGLCNRTAGPIGAQGRLSNALDLVLGF